MASLIRGVNAPEVDKTRQYLDEMDLAQQRYRAYSNRNVADEDVKAMYIDPVNKKWDILNSVPIEYQNNAQKELEAAHINYLKGIQSGYKDNDAAKMFLTPVQDKWSGVSSIPQPAKADPYREDKLGGISIALSGNEEVTQDFIRSNPHNIFADSKYVADWTQAVKEGQKSRMEQTIQASKFDAKQKEKEMESLSPETLINELGSIDNKLKPYIQSGNMEDPVAKILTQRRSVVSDWIKENSQSLNQVGKTQTTSFSPNQKKFTFKMPLDKQSQMLDVSQYETPDDVGQAFKNNEITMQQAKQILSVKFGNKFKK